MPSFSMTTFASGTNMASHIISSFGIISDIQYADVEDASNFEGTAKRYYRRALNHLENTVAYWKQNEKQMNFVMQLGDLVDGKNKGKCLAFKKCLDVLDKLEKPVHHVIGNHDLYNLTRKQLQAGHSLNTSLLPGVCKSIGNKKLYYHFEVCQGLRMIVLDTYEISLLGNNEDDIEYNTAVGICKAINQNEDLNDPTDLKYEDRCFTKFNGQISEDQMQWLEGILAEADDKMERVIVTAHLPVMTHDALNHCWNYKEMLELLHRHSSPVMYLAGHAHHGCYILDDHGLHHLTMHGVIESDPATCDFGVIDVYKENLVVKGKGKVPSLTINLMA